MSNTGAPVKLIKKLIDVARNIGTLKKSGYNQHQKYHYATEADLIDALKEQLLTRNVFVFTSSKITQIDKLTNKNKDGDEKTSLVTSVETTHTFVDGESGESYSVNSVGSGHDSTDKGVFKAITGANKYFVSKNFMVASEDDPENDGGTKPAPAKTGGSLFGAKKAEPVSVPPVVIPTPVSTAGTPIENKVLASVPPTPPPVTTATTTLPAPTSILRKKPTFNKNKVAN